MELTRRSALRAAASIPLIGTLSASREVSATGYQSFSHWVEGRAKGGLFNGTVVVAHDDTVVLRQTHGMANLDYGVPVKPSTKFNTASMFKMFTATAIGLLLEAGKLQMDTTIDRFLGPDWLDPEISKRVNVGELLNHTSGLGSYFTQDFMRSSRLLYLSPEAFKPIVRKETLQSEPGKEHHYSNTGYLLLGQIVAGASGQTYDDFLQSRIFGPLGMVGTGLFALNEPLKDVAVGYDREASSPRPPASAPETPTPDLFDEARDAEEYLRWIAAHPGKISNNLFLHVVRGTSAGGGFTTAPDLVRFGHGLRSGAILKPETRKLFWSPTKESPIYGRGFMLVRNSVGHGGGFPGISTWYSYWPQIGRSLIVLSNCSQQAVPVAAKFYDLYDRA